jgi:DNA-binding MarR family transcriptional regulator
MGEAEDVREADDGLATAWLRAARQVDVLFRHPAMPSPTQWELLDILLARGPLALMDTALLAGISGATAARAVQAAQARGWLVKDRDPQDRRIVWLRVTAAGAAVHGAVVAAAARRLDTLLAGVSAEDRRRMRIALERIYRNGRHGPPDAESACGEEEGSRPKARDESGS